MTDTEKKLKRAEWARKHYQKNKDKIKKQSKAWREANEEIYLEYQRQYRIDNSEKITKYKKRYRADNYNMLLEYNREHSRKFRANNSDILAKRQRQYQIDNPGICNARASKRRASKLQRTPVWADFNLIKDVCLDCEEINLAAKTAGCTETFQVDHVIPLQSKLVSGLHMENNLQIITVTENLSKSNKFNI